MSIGPAQERTFATPTHLGVTMTPAEPCPLTSAIAVIGGRWNLIVLYWLAADTRRFGDLQRLMPDVTHKMLTSTLRQLESADLVRRHVYPEVPPRVEYSLTKHGQSITPVVDVVRSWGHRHLEHQRGPAATTAS
jgi:DNA-binding HxlR family transcriptional regulator